jgi:hypothetical protein
VTEDECAPIIVVNVGVGVGVEVVGGDPISDATDDVGNGCEEIDEAGVVDSPGALPLLIHLFI